MSSSSLHPIRSQKRFTQRCPCFHMTIQPSKRVCKPFFSESKPMMLVTVTIHNNTVMVLSCYFYSLAGLHPNIVDEPSICISDPDSVSLPPFSRPRLHCIGSKSSAPEWLTSAMLRREHIDLLEMAFSITFAMRRLYCSTEIPRRHRH